MPLRLEDVAEDVKDLESHVDVAEAVDRKAHDGVLVRVAELLELVRVLDLLLYPLEEEEEVV